MAASGDSAQGALEGGDWAPLPRTGLWGSGAAPGTTRACSRLPVRVLSVSRPGRSFIPDEHMVWCPEQLLQCVLAHIHYIPDHWQGSAHKAETREEMAQLFQYKAVSGGPGGAEGGCAGPRVGRGL